MCGGNMKKALSIVVAVALLLSFSACDPSEPFEREIPVTETFGDAVHIALSDDMTEAPEGVTLSHDIVYYEAGRDFTYGEGTEADAHSAEEAAEHLVVTITEPGDYLLTGTLTRGQIAVDLGEEAKEDPDAVVTLILGGVDITCTVAPAVIFYNVYECGDADTPAKDVDTSAAGANVIVADYTNNTVRGSYVARIYKSVELSEDGTEVIGSKKLHKYDGAFYSKMSMNVNGEAEDEGYLYIYGENEGLDSEMHLTINGGYIQIRSGNDGINTNEDGVSVATVNGGFLDIVVDDDAAEGDGIDSNGWIVINGGTVQAYACGTSADAGLDADMGVDLNGGIVDASGNMMDAKLGGTATYMVLQFTQRQRALTQVYLCEAATPEGRVKVAANPCNDYQYLLLASPELEPGEYAVWQLEKDPIRLKGYASDDMGFGGIRPPEAMERPEGMELPEGMEPPEGMERPEGMEPPNGMQRPNGMGGMPQGSSEADDVFTIFEGGNVFTIA